VKGAERLNLGTHDIGVLCTRNPKMKF
jgi:hypothetical protein